MFILQWVTKHGTSLLESVGIIAGLVFTGITLRRDARSRHVGNLITLTAQHREIWQRFYEQPELARIREPKVDLKKSPPTRDEALFVNLLILHLNCWFQAIERKEITPPEGLGMDVGGFYSLPIPNAIWQQRRKFHDLNFVSFVDEAIHSHHR